MDILLMFCLLYNLTIDAWCRYVDVCWWCVCFYPAHFNLQIFTLSDFFSIKLLERTKRNVIKNKKEKYCRATKAFSLVLFWWFFFLMWGVSLWFIHLLNWEKSQFFLVTRSLLAECVSNTELDSSLCLHLKRTSANILESWIAFHEFNFKSFLSHWNVVPFFAKNIFL
jgi:hypothetical protein